MFKRVAVVAVWVVATFATATITLAAVGRAGSEVSDHPAMPISSAELAARFASTTTAAATTSTSTTGGTTTTTVPATTTTSAPTTTTTTAVTTTTAGGSQNQTYRQKNVGTVTIRVDGKKVFFVSALPETGFKVEHESESDGSKVVVKFESDHAEYTFTAKFADGTLQAGFSEAKDD